MQAAVRSYPLKIVENRYLCTCISVISGGHNFAKVKIAAASQSSPSSTPVGSGSRGVPPGSSGSRGPPPGSRGSTPGSTRRNPSQDSPTPRQRLKNPSQASKRPTDLSLNPTDLPRESYNTGYLDQSLDRDSVSHRNADNPLYKERSPTSRPPLPFPGQHYDIYRSPTDSNNGGDTVL